MTKEVYIALIQKDIKELGVLTQGLYENDTPSPTIIRLLSTKAQDIVSNLQLLAELKDNTAISTKSRTTDESAPNLQIENKTEKSTLSIEEIISETVSVETEKIIEIKEEKTQKDIKPKIKKTGNNISTTISDVIKSKEEILLDSLAKKRIDSIKKSISMGDRFLFQRELFDNKAELMNNTLDFIDSCNDIKEAERYIANNFTWNSENEVVLNFFAILTRRFT